jgi:hypothetical protein
MKVAKITEEHFNDVKRSLKNKWRWTRFTKRHIEEIAELHGISLKTVMQIKNSETYKDYQDQNKAQHPPQVKFSLKEQILELHRLTYDLKDNKYIPPKTAQVAIMQLIYEKSK